MIKAIIRSIKTFIHIQLNAYKTALVLDDCCRAMAQMNHPHRDTHITDAMLMPTKLRAELIDRACWNALPTWKWRSE
jgi:hypothetical protein